MLRSSLLVLVLLGGCVADAEQEPAATIEIKVDGMSGDRNTAPPETMGPERDAPHDVCALAAQLAADDVCSLMCDPEAMAAAMIAEGMHTGTCYQLRCALPDSTYVGVGVCLAPPPP